MTATGSTTPGSRYPYKDEPQDSPVVAWEECPDCGDFVCNIHPGEHVADCDCPAIEVWAEHDKFPYEERVTDELKKWVEMHPFADE